MRCFMTLASLLIVSSVAAAADEAKPNTLTPKEIADGWILLFDGETTFGWENKGNVTVKDGVLVVTEPKPKKKGLWVGASLVHLPHDFELLFDVNGEWMYVEVGGSPHTQALKDWTTFRVR